MFDANMRHLPEGKEFFAKVLSVQPCSWLYPYVNANDLIPCTRVGGDTENPQIRMHFLKEKIDILATENSLWRSAWLCYEGNIDGTDFIDPVSQAKAEHLIKLIEERIEDEI